MRDEDLSEEKHSDEDEDAVYTWGEQLEEPPIRYAGLPEKEAGKSRITPPKKTEEIYQSAPREATNKNQAELIAKIKDLEERIEKQEKEYEDKLKNLALSKKETPIGNEEAIQKGKKDELAKDVKELNKTKERLKRAEANLELTTKEKQDIENELAKLTEEIKKLHQKKKTMKTILKI